jgi:hypothetical protein
VQSGQTKCRSGWRLTNGCPLAEAFDAVRLDQRERQLVLAVGEGLTFQQAAAKVGANNRQRAHQIACKVADKLGLPRSVFESIRGVYAADVADAGAPAAQANFGWAANDVRENADLRDAIRRAKAPLSPEERLQRQLQRAADLLLKQAGV